MISPVDTEVVVIGAGIAGLAAAKILGTKRCIVLEAQSKIGGRVATQTIAPNVYWDEGAHWIHDTGSKHIVWQQLTSAQKTVSHGPHLLINSMGKQNAEGFWEKLEDIFQNLSVHEPDEPLERYIPKDDPFFRHCIQTTSGRDPHEVSRYEHALSKESGEDIVLPQGYGTFLLHLFKDVPVRLQQPVHTIEWGKNGIVVHTPDATIRGKVVIITVSIGVLQAKCIRFVPPLSRTHQKAINGLKMGYAERICLSCSVKEEWINGYFLVDMGSIVVGLECFPHGQPYVSAYVAGTDALQEDLEGIAVRALFRAGFHGEIQSVYASSWKNNIYTQGSYSSCFIGQYGCRKELATPNPPLFFAGEATSKSFATVHGAWESGERAAKECLLWLDGERTI